MHHGVHNNVTTKSQRGATLARWGYQAEATGYCGCGWITFGLSPEPPVVGGWIALPDYYDDNKEVLANIIRGWAEANDYIVRNTAAAAEALQKNHYPHASIADVTEAFKAQKMFSSREWKRLYSDGTVTKWLQQVSDFFMTDAGLTGTKPAAEYFDPSLYLATI